ncbi:class I SAM-dependent methyltransferase [Candidatus Woesearchaeota archaeon]|nr:class I SAM-dependent methyltransferase [Candidatus Woesearchaeota archaeon]
MGDTEKGFWGAAITEHLYEFFKKIKLQNYKNFLDLGSGDGKVVLIASLFGVKATGIEFDKDLIKTSQKIKNELKLKADFIQSDFFKHDVSKYDIIFVNPDKGFENGLEDKLIKDMNPKTKLLVYNQIFLPRFLKKGKTTWFDQVPVIEYKNK